MAPERAQSGEGEVSDNDAGYLDPNRSVRLRPKPMTPEETAVVCDIVALERENAELRRLLAEALFVVDCRRRADEQKGKPAPRYTKILDAAAALGVKPEEGA